ncbi:ribonuclease H-like domain-containing protein [Tanacetum coccineum]|uniref:Ribonuclease H-like domain-containing protein n=1 Tax=Tanacetum coccineum TaxID=301880 RepID=A0ABQ5AMQ2_9ASTR
MELLAEYGLLACKPALTPIESKLVITDKPVNKKDKPLSNITEYQKLLGKLIYLTHTRLDISYAIHSLSQFMHSPLTSHLKLALSVLKYLKNALGKGIHISKTNSLMLMAYVDSDWAKCKATRRSSTGFTVFLGKSLTIISTWDFVDKMNYGLTLKQVMARNFYEFKRFLDRLNDDDAIVVPHEDAQATLGDTNDPFTSISMSKDFPDKDIAANDAY